MNKYINNHISAPSLISKERVTRGEEKKEASQKLSDFDAHAATLLIALAACGEAIDASEQLLCCPLLDVEHEVLLRGTEHTFPLGFSWHLLDSHACDFCMNR